MPIEFHGSGGYTIGVEEELDIVDAATGELSPKIEEIMARLPEELAEPISYELFQSVLETKTPSAPRSPKRRTTCGSCAAGSGPGPRPAALPWPPPGRTLSPATRTRR